MYKDTNYITKTLHVAYLPQLLLKNDTLIKDLGYNSKNGPVQININCRNCTFFHD